MPKPVPVNSSDNKQGKFGWDNEFIGTEVTVPRFAIINTKLLTASMLNSCAPGRNPLIFCDGTRRQMDLQGHVLGNSAACECAGVCDLRGSHWHTRAGREKRFHGSPISPGGFGTPGDEERYPVGRKLPRRLSTGISTFTHWDTIDVTANARAATALLTFHSCWATAGSGPHGVRPISGFRTIPVLSRLLEKFLLTNTMYERRIERTAVCSCGALPELVPARLPLCLRQAFAWSKTDVPERRSDLRDIAAKGARQSSKPSSWHCDIFAAMSLAARCSKPSPGSPNTG